MLVYFVRHATAASKSTWDRDDASRPLTRSGTRRFSAGAEALVRAGVLRSELIITSPLVRARETAELLRQALDGPAKIVEDERLGTTFSAEDFACLVAENADRDAIAIVGHNPSFAGVLSAVTGGSAIDMRKGAIALVAMEDAERSGSLQWLAPPALFSAASEGSD